MTEPALWISETDVAELFSLDATLETLRRTYAADPADGSTMPRAHARSGKAILHAVGGVSPVDGLAGTKTWLYTPRGATPLTILYDLDGALQGVVEAFRLGQWRTGATTALATELLAPEAADVLAVVGAGKQSLPQMLAVSRVRQLRRVQVWGRDAERLEAFAADAAETLGVEVVPNTDLGAALAGAGIVVTVSRADDPFIGPEHLPAGAHVNAVGAIVASRSELRAEAVGRFDVVVADSIEQARADSGELIAAVDHGLLAWDDVLSLHDVVTDPEAGRDSKEQLTLFKSLGVGMSDVALAGAVVALARESGAGTALPTLASAHH